MTMTPLGNTPRFLFSVACLAAAASPYQFRADCLNEPLCDSVISVTLQQDDAGAIIEQGQQYLKQKEWKAAIAEFSKAIAKSPEQSEGYLGLGSAYEGLNQWDQAIEQYGLVIAKNSKNVAAYLGRARAWSKKKELVKSLEDLESAVAIDVPGGGACFYRGMLFQIQREWAKAERDYSTVIKHRPNFPTAFTQRAYVRIQKGELAKAISDYDSAIRIDPNDPETFIGRGLTYKHQKQFAKALADYDRALALDPNSSAALNNKAWMLATCSDTKFRDGNLAVELAKKAVQKDPSSTILDTLAVSYAAVGDFENAVIQLKRALEIKDLSEAEAQELKEHLALFEKKRPYR